MTLFETETMAELCIKQGLDTQGLEIYRRLVRDAPDELTRARRQRRLGELERALGPAATAAAAEAEDPHTPALQVRPRGEEIEVEWILPVETRAPALQLLLVRRTPAGVETEARTVRLAGPQGRTVLPAARGLHSVRAAAGRLEGERFVPLARASAETPAARRV
jgi:hypothetical protein